MRLDVNIAPEALADVAGLAKAAEGLGFDGVWTSETQHDPFLPLALIPPATQVIQFGTAVAIAFARSPATVAYTAWDLASASGGRFILGLGTQVRAHVERRFGMRWPRSPVDQLREFVAGLRAFWRAWQQGERLNQRGDYYKLTLMTPFFNPGPIDHPDIPIFLAGVNPGLIGLAGEVADGLHGHPLHSARYLREVVRPALDAGGQRAGRRDGAAQLSVAAFVATNSEEADEVRAQISFYASTPSYRPVLALHGWQEAAERLSQLARRGEWERMPALISDEMVETFAVVAPEERLGPALRARYEGLADRVTPYPPFRPGRRDSFWRALAAGWR